MVEPVVVQAPVRGQWAIFNPPGHPTLAFDFLAGFDIDNDDMLRANFFEAKAMRLHENLVLPWHPHRHVAENIVPVTFVRQDIARVGEILFKFFDAGGHGCSLSEAFEVNW